MEAIRHARKDKDQGNKGRKGKYVINRTDSSPLMKVRKGISEDQIGKIDQKTNGCGILLWVTAPVSTPSKLSPKHAGDDAQHPEEYTCIGDRTSTSLNSSH